MTRCPSSAELERWLADGLSGANSIARAALLISICAGVQLQRIVLGNPALRRPDPTLID